MSKKKNRLEVKEEILNFFESIRLKKPSEVKKIKKIAMHNNIKLGILKRKFCSKCFFPLENPRKRLNKGKINITCRNCGNIKRYEYKN